MERKGTSGTAKKTPHRADAKSRKTTATSPSRRKTTKTTTKTARPTS